MPRDAHIGVPTATERDGHEMIGLVKRGTKSVQTGRGFLK
jgi:hypothetical protein